MKYLDQVSKGNYQPFNWLTRRYFVLILGVGLLISLIFAISQDRTTTTNSYTNILIGITNTAAIWLGCVFIVKFLWRKYPWHEKPVTHLVLEFFLITFYTLLVSMIIFFTQKHLFVPYDPQNIAMAIFTTLLITYLITAIHESVFFYKQWIFHFGKSSLLERDNLSARYETLRTQINPHFLFNSLNGLSGLIGENLKAQEYLGHLSGLMRAMLSGNERELTLLRDEIKVLRSYLALQHLRFGDNLIIRMEVPENVYHFALPPLSLQMLVENAMKHNIITREHPLELHIGATNKAVYVRNNLQPKTAEPSSGKGLANIAGRYAHFTTRKPEIKQENGWFIVSLPLLEVEL